MHVSERRVFQDSRVYLYSAFYQKAFETFNSVSDKRLEVFLMHTQIRKENTVGGGIGSALPGFQE